MKKQVITSIIYVLLLGVFVVGVTYAGFLISFSGNNDITTNSKKFEIVYPDGGDTFNGPIEMVSSKEDGYIKTLRIKVANGSVEAKLNLYIKINQISSSLACSNFIWDVYGYDSTENQVYHNNGTFNGYSATAGSNIVNLVNYDYTITTDETTFVIYLWLNGSGLSNTIAGATFSGSLEAQTENFTGIPKQ